ncbi:hypothetical protein EHI8A_155680 [Entamoeba histolytica HM-1:IMSS-B]|uniref:Ras-GEF domain-containing protein n=6 Tax=Entamoeba histolytica TaxID=5759 RepID=C4LSQ8_ENTH1|nr:hypothetical protein EHI_152200 [Entamoeba histolytica HM-1:IMSS]EMD47204.1 Hypothetical protein EHI5A_025490 [Entamoeba histolytica KU27]EMH73012.1 hypothetical protein EHI8A_155680 [Entamoeba histolytica HM-1:IMSS-B]EMS17953.1 hypothetical protein KM1_156380 [Entamoeba histolytica HM-3:IMSS]ENY65409.1 hypothetical protein EHI7A_140100 [Entamoeba histolytica HM-1:IMSS-A]GAT91470.1 hypothetical protein CL6EHI_152200 [Entamoeba histolytica]|eukprot:XP_655801.2 hypothetical protein EHI_152200 [Entamoeba histolytica HM-1:IMSS]
MTFGRRSSMVKHTSISKIGKENARWSAKSPRRKSITQEMYNEEIPEDVLNLFKSSVGAEELINAAKIAGVRFFCDEKLFDVIEKEYIKNAVWKMEKTHRDLFKVVVTELFQVHRRSQLYKVLFPSSIKTPLNTRKFLHTLFENVTFIFNNESGEIKFTENGNLISISPFWHWNFALDLHEVSISRFIIECISYMTVDDFLNKLIDVCKDLNENMYMPETQRKTRVLRLQSIIVSWINLMKEEIIPNNSVVEKLLNSCLFKTDVISENILKNIKKEIQPTSVIDPICFQPQPIKKFNCRLKIDKIYCGKGIKKVRIYKVKSDVVAKQIIMFNQRLWNTVHFSEFFYSKNTPTLDNYVNKIQFIEKLTKASLEYDPSSKMLNFYIKVSYHCMILGDFNSSCLIYSVLSIFCSDIRNKKIFNELKSETKKKYRSLENVYSISMQHANYRNAYADHHDPKIPVLALLLGENIRSDMMETYIQSNQLNVLKIRKVSDVVDMLYNAKEISFVFSEIPEVMQYFQNLIAFFK